MSTKEAIIRTTIRVPEKLWTPIRQRAVTERTSAQDLVIAALESHLKAKGGK